MPLEVKENTAVLSGHAEITEAEILLEWLRSEATPVVDLSACASAHTAILQVLLALRPRLITGLPAGRPEPQDWRSLLPEDLTRVDADCTAGEST